MILLNYNEIEKNIKKIMKNSKNIRKKIEQDTKQHRYIVTVMKVGYKFGGTFNG